MFFLSESNGPTPKRLPLFPESGSVRFLQPLERGSWWADYTPHWHKLDRFLFRTMSCDWCDAEAQCMVKICCPAALCASCACGVAWMSGHFKCCGKQHLAPINKAQDYRLWNNVDHKNSNITRLNPVSWTPERTMIAFCSEGIVVRVVLEDRDVKCHIVEMVGDGTLRCYYGDRWLPCVGRWLPV